MNRRSLCSLALGGLAVLPLAGAWRAYAAAEGMPAGSFPFKLSEAQWRQRLSPDEFAILRQAATERPGSSPLVKEHRAGTFQCRGCGLPVFSSKTKYDSNTGWPSFWQGLPRAIGTGPDTSYGMNRTEVHCQRCGSHLGHVFDDGPKPTGLRYCMNGLALAFVPGKA